jgi:hypothetical protein
VILGIALFWRRVEDVEPLIFWLFDSLYEPSLDLKIRILKKTKKNQIFIDFSAYFGEFSRQLPVFKFSALFPMN